MNEQKAHKTIIGTVHNKKGQLYNDIACLDVFVCFVHCKLLFLFKSNYH